jgi:nucleoside-diphosphate-sugar epimerase
MTLRAPSALDLRAPRTALVTGASGFLGMALVQRLLADGQGVRVLVRSTARARQLAKLGAEPVVGQIDDEVAVADALHRASTVYHLAGRLLVPGVPESEYRRTHVTGTRVLLEGMRRQHPVPRLVHCSTTGVLGATGDVPANEEAPWRPSNIYEATKAEAEMEVRRAIRDGLPVVIVRPGLVYGPGDLHLLGFFRAVLAGRFRPIGRRTVWLHPIYIDDTVEALALCGRAEAALGECFHIAGPQPVSVLQLAATIAQAEGTSLPRGAIPLPLARAAAAAGDLLPARLRHLAPLTRSRLDFLTHSRVYSVEKSRRRLGFVALTDLSTGIARAVAWYRERGYLPPMAAAVGWPRSQLVRG